MRSGTTFEEEFDALSSVPDVFYTDPHGAEGAEGSVLPERYRSPAPDLAGEATRTPWGTDEDLPSRTNVDTVNLDMIATALQGSKAKDGDIIQWLRDELGLNVELALEELSKDGDAMLRVAAGVAELGAEYYAAYLPWHQYGKSEATPWGMYLNLERVFMGALRFTARARAQGKELDRVNALLLAFFVPYRHELFHFHVERFATRQEVLSRRAIYKPYDNGVFRPTAWSSRWLEEALAQAAVLESKFVKNRIGLDAKSLRRLLEAEFDEMPPGYRDYHCRQFGGPDRAQRLFAAQIVTGTERPGFAATAIALPKSEYAVDPRKVPGYLTYRESFLSRFQLATPEMRKVQTWLQRAGFVQDGPGPGDHERWKHEVSGQVVQLNRRGKECDLASMKAVARIVGINVRKLTEIVRAS